MKRSGRGGGENEGGGVGGGSRRSRRHSKVGETKIKTRTPSLEPVTARLGIKSSCGEKLGKEWTDQRPKGWGYIKFVKEFLCCLLNECYEEQAEIDPNYCLFWTALEMERKTERQNERKREQNK